MYKQTGTAGFIAQSKNKTPRHWQTIALSESDVYLPYFTADFPYSE